MDAEACAVNGLLTMSWHISNANGGGATMTEAVRRKVYGPNGPLTIADLPVPGTKRWVIRRKAEVVAAVRGGILSLELACHRYTLSPEEYLSWQDSIDRYGFAALRVTRLNDYRFRPKTHSWA
jgi:hypothetical protein